jgi:hypothetical protein
MELQAESAARILAAPIIQNVREPDMDKQSAKNAALLQA